MTLAKFLRARLAERKSHIQRLKVERWELDGGHLFGAVSADEIVWIGDRADLGAYLVDGSPDLMLAQVEALERIVDAYEAAGAAWHEAVADPPTDRATIHKATAALIALEGAVRHLSTVHADHPDYDQRWRP